MAINSNLFDRVICPSPSRSTSRLRSPVHVVSLPTKAGGVLANSLGPRGRPGSEGGLGKGMSLASLSPIR